MQLGGGWKWAPSSLEFQNEALVPSAKPSALAHTISPSSQSVDFKYPDSTLVPHTLFSNACDKRIVFAKRDPLDRRRELPSEQAFACLDFPEPHGIICRARYEELGFR